MNLDFSLIDANIVRAKEGIRVVEDICRFVLKEQVFFVNLKKIRHELDNIENKLLSANLLYSRLGGDFGRVEVVKSEYNRKNAWQMVRANCRRISEALRVLEEYTKIYNKTLAYQIESYRYKIYELELKISLSMPQFWLNKYFEEGVVYAITDNVEEAVWLIDHGAKIIQLRDKKSSRLVVYKKVKYLCDYLEAKKQKNNKVLLFVNDDIEIASVLPVAGVHLGQDDCNIVEARKKIGSFKIIGHSNHSLEQIQTSAEEGWDYVSIGPIYETPTKMGRKAVGLEIIQEVNEKINIPWLAIGGINKETISEVKKVGAKNFAVVRSAKDFFNK